MIDIAAYIGVLVKEHELVVIPGLGGFLTRSHASIIHALSNRIESPGRHIAFNSKLKENDGLLANYFAKKANISYKMALNLVETFAASCQLELEMGHRVSFENLGILNLSEEGYIEFVPDLTKNYADEYFGLPDILISPIDRESKHIPVVQLHPQAKEKIKQSATVLRKVAAIAIPFFVLGWLVFLTKDKINTTFQQVASVIAFNSDAAEITPVIEEKRTINIVIEEPAENVVEETEFITNDSEVVMDDLPIPAQGTYHLICGAFSHKVLADRLVKELKSEGFESYIAGQNSIGLYRVSSSNFLDKEKAISQLQWFQAHKNNAAWLLDEDL